MDITSARHPLAYTGDEKYQMLELNRRLESYLGHVKLLEEENQLLWGEIQVLRRSQDTGSQRKAQEEALSLTRKEVQNAWREKDLVELEASNLLEEIEELNTMRQKERTAQHEAKRRLEESRKTLEDERRMQIWLREKAAHLEKEISLQVQVHQEDLSALKSSSAFSKPALMASQKSQPLNLQGLGNEYSQRAAQAWHEAAGTYQIQVEKLEKSLNQTRTHMTQIKQDKRKNQLQVQDLAKKLESAKAKRELMEKNMVQQRERQNQDLQHLQAHVEALEGEKMNVGEQIGELLVESRNLLQMKMSLSLEVATYRALLDSERLRVNNQSPKGITKSPGTYPGTQTLSSCQFSSLLNTTSISITNKANLMTSTTSCTLTQGTPQETPKKSQTTEEEEVIISVEKPKLESSEALPKKDLTGADSLDYYRAEDAYEEISYASSVSVSVVPKAVDQSESILSTNVTEDLQEVLRESWASTNEAALISLPAGNVSGLLKTPEREVSSSLHTEESKSSEDGDEEETEVSTEMAIISHAPVSAWEENDTVIPEERDVVSEVELESESIIENSTEELRIDAGQAELKQLGENTNKPASPLFQQTPLSADTFSPVEEDSEILTWADVKEDVIHFVEEELLKSAPEVERELVEGIERTGEVEEKTEVEEVEWPRTEALEGHEFHIEVQDEENKEEESKLEESKVEQRKEEEVINGEQDRMTEEDITVIGENFGEQKAELVMDTYDKDNQLVEPHAEEEQGQSDEDESLNISASWRTDPGEADSYAQENTLADTRPLIHYKSDEETDANIPTSHLGVSEPTDSEEEREKHEGSHWSEKISKRFDTMDDLSEEPEIGSIYDIVTDGSVQTVVKENMDEIASEESVLQNESGDEDNHVNIPMNDILVGQSENNLRNNSKESSYGEEEINKENNDILLVEKHEESSQLHDLSGSLHSETWEINEQQILLTKPSNFSEDDITGGNTENWDVESIEIKAEDEGEVKKHFDTPLLEPSQEQALAEEPSEEASTETTHSDVLPYETARTKEQACLKEEEDEPSNLSMLTHADFTDECSLHCGLNSQPESQTNTVDSDLEASNCSEDDSPNSSQCSQLLTQAEIPTQQLNWDSMTTMGRASKNDPSFTGLLMDVMREGFENDTYKDDNAPQAEELENVGNKEEQQDAVANTSSGMDKNAGSLPQTQEWENLGHEITSPSHSILSTAEEFGDMKMENNEDNMDILQSNVLNEEPQTKGRENDLHSFFSSSIKEGIWSTTNFELAATYDPNDQAVTERYSFDSINPNQTTDWGDLVSLPTNGKPEKELGTIVPSEEEEREEQKMPQAKQVQCRDVKDGEVETVHAEDSTDEGDSWSSGEE